MDPVLYSRARRIFLDVLELPPTKRLDRARETCFGEPALEALVLSLIAQHGAGGDSVESDLLADVFSPEKTFPRIPGRIGRWLLGPELGRGGMGVVFQARDAEEEGETVAVKLLRPELVSESALRRFERETAALSRLRHPGIVRQLETGHVETDGIDVPYLVMERVEGVSIVEHARQSELVTSHRLTLLVDVCAAVEHAHSQGIIHRDLKPQNILVAPTGQPRILDFGVATTLGVDTTRLTWTGQVVGTVAYMSPEQAAGRPAEVDARTDIYACGLIGFELLAGVPPYQVPATAMGDALAAVISARPRTLGEVVPELKGTPIEQVLSRALEPDAKDRYATMSEMLTDLRRAQAGLFPEHAGRERAARFARRVRASRTSLALVGIGLAVLVLAALQGLSLWRQAISERREIDRQYEAAYARIDEADRLFAESGRSAERVSAAIDEFTEAKDLLRRIAKRPERMVLWRLVWFRIGTTHMIRGLLLHSYDDLVAAAEALDSSLSALITPEGLESVAAMDSSHVWKDAATSLDATTILTAAANVRRMMALYRSPRDNLLRSQDLNRMAIQEDVRSKGWEYRDDLTWISGHHRHAEALHSSAETFQLLGELSDSLSLVDDSIRYLRRSLEIIGDARPQRNAMMVSLGSAFAARGRITDSAADFDSSAAWFLKALDAGPETANPHLYAARGLLLARSLLDRADRFGVRSQDPPEIERWTRKAEESSIVRGDSIGLADVAVVRARTLLHATPSCKGIHDSVELLSRARRSYLRVGLTVPATWARFHEARALRALTECTHESHFLEAAAGHLREVQGAAGLRDWPAIYRLAGRELEAIGGANRSG